MQLHRSLEELKKKSFKKDLKKITIIVGDSKIGKSLMVNFFCNSVKCENSSQDSFLYLDFGIWIIEKIYNDHLKQVNNSDFDENINITHSIISSFIEIERINLINEINAFKQNIIIFDNINEIEFQKIIIELFHTEYEEIEKKIVLILDRMIYFGFKREINSNMNKYDILSEWSK